MALLGALLFGTAGLALGSWYGGRGAVPLSPEAARSAAGGLLPGVEPSGSMTMRGYRYGVFLAERDGMTVTLTHRAYGSRLSIEPSAPGGFRAATITGTLLGAAAGAALFWVVARSRWPVPLLVGTLVTVALFPGAVFTWTDLAVHRLAEPVWPVWRGFAPVLVPLWLVLLLVGVIVLARRRDPAVPVTDPVAGRPRTPDQPGPVQRDLGAVTEA